MFAAEGATGPTSIAFALVAITTFCWRYFFNSNLEGLVIVNARRPLEFSHAKVKERFLSSATDLINSGFGKGRTVFGITTDHGVEVIISHKHADAIRNNSSLSLQKQVEQELQGHLPGLTPFKFGAFSHEVLRGKLAKSIDTLSKPVSEETSIVLRDLWLESTDWHEVSTHETMAGLISRISARVFVGKELCRDPAWFNLTQGYTMSALEASRDIRRWPKRLRSIVHWFIPSCSRARADLNRARVVLSETIQRRRAHKEAAIMRGEEPEHFVDAVEWLEDMSKEVDPINFHIALSSAAIHTTADMMTQLLFNIMDNGELIKALREEAVSVIAAEGFKKSSLYKLKLMDSVIKETLRLKPFAIVSMRRIAQEKVTLPEGTTLPKGTMLAVAAHHSASNPSHKYENAAVFQGDRFLKLREVVGFERSSQAVSTSPEFLSFGHGRHACPGRFLAVLEAKIALCHILLKYEFKNVIGKPPTIGQQGFDLMSDHSAKITVKRRSVRDEDEQKVLALIG